MIEVKTKAEKVSSSAFQITKQGGVKGKSS